MKIKKATSLQGEILVPGDKSISHRSIMLGALAKGTSEVSHFLQSADCLSTIECFNKMGITIENTGTTVKVHGKGLHGLEKPSSVLDVGNSGTTMRLMSGILAPQPFEVIVTGDASIQKRPMGRIMEPLKQMNAHIESQQNNNCAPLIIKGKSLHGIHYKSPVASAQVKSCILLAGLYGDQTTSVTEPYLSRNHSELMLKHFGAEVQTIDTTASVEPCKELYANKVIVPGDISSAAYFIAAGLLVPNSEIIIKNVGLNPTRDGIIQVCKSMGANISIENICEDDGEPRGDLIVKSSALHGTIVEGAIIPTLIDEIPVIAVMACFAEGKTIIKDAAELKVKESNRIDVMVDNLSKLGANVTSTEDGMIIEGGKTLVGNKIDSHLDHRIAMSFAVCGLIAEGTTEIIGSECVNISYPKFYDDLFGLIK